VAKGNAKHQFGNVEKIEAIKNPPSEALGGFWEFGAASNESVINNNKYQ
jgi:hypothetical protein